MYILLVVSVPYLIYLEYIDYGTLKDFLMRNYQQSSSGSSNKDDVRDYDKTLQLTTFAFDICQGMLFLDKQSVCYLFLRFSNAKTLR